MSLVSPLYQRAKFAVTKQEIGLTKAGLKRLRKKQARKRKAEAKARSYGKPKLVDTATKRHRRVLQIRNLWTNLGFSQSELQKALSACGYTESAPIPKKAKAAFAQEMRDNPTPAEAALQAELLRRFPGVFENQVVLMGWIVDFFSKAHKLIVEVDGNVHDSAEQKSKDQHRTATLEKRGHTLIRFRNEQVLNNIDSVIDSIALKLIPLGQSARITKTHQVRGPNGRPERRVRPTPTPCGHVHEVADAEMGGAVAGTLTTAGD